jgi:hypothetical protein
MKNKFSTIFGITLVLSIMPFMLQSVKADVLPNDIVMKSTNLDDNVVGNGMGWNPDGEKYFFDINDDSVEFELSNILVNVDQDYYDVDKHALCQATFIEDDGFTIVCDMAPADGSFLSYIVFNQWPKIITESPDGPYPAVNVDSELNNNTSPFIMESIEDRSHNETSGLNNNTFSPK